MRRSAHEHASVTTAPISQRLRLAARRSRIFPERSCNTMDDDRFDQFTRTFARSGSRRTLLKSLLGLGGVAAAGAALHDADAARRGYAGPPIPAPRPTEPPLGECIALECNGQCCDRHATVCCGGFCCTGGCHETECCGAGNTYCDGYGCCAGICLDHDPTCCPHNQICGAECCGDGGYCCEKADGSHVCTQIGRCCSGLQCPGGRCDSEGFCR
jgi:hypothetical protein